MYPVLTVFGRQIGTYGLCSVVGILIAGFAGVLFGKKRGWTMESIILLVLSAGGGILIGGHLLYGLLNIRIWGKALLTIGNRSFVHTVKIFGYCFGGSVFYGGLFASVLAVRIYTRHCDPEEKNAGRDIYSLCIPLFHAFGRIGCFLGGCCYGMESKFGFIVEQNDYVPAICGVRRFPVALAEALCNAIIFAILCFLFTHKKTVSGKLFWYYGSCYSVVRFLLEFLRGDRIRGLFFGLSTSQWISIVFFAVSVTMLVKCLCLKQTVQEPK